MVSNREYRLIEETQRLTLASGPRERALTPGIAGEPGLHELGAVLLGRDHCRRGRHVREGRPLPR